MLTNKYPSASDSGATVAVARSTMLEELAPLESRSHQDRRVLHIVFISGASESVQCDSVHVTVQMRTVTCDSAQES